jgi:hypothetical protein
MGAIVEERPFTFSFYCIAARGPEGKEFIVQIPNFSGEA